MNHPLKILVVGAGIAGPALCYWLKQFGFSPTLIEKSATLRKGGQALDVRGVATSLTRKMGIYDKIVAMRTRIECGRYMDVHGNVVHEEHGEKFGFRQDDEVEIVRGDLVKILMDIIPDVPCRFNQSIKQIHQDDDAVTVTFENGSVEKYDLVIGADGIYSATRRLTFDNNDVQLVNLGPYLSTFTIPNYLHLSHTELVCESKQRWLSINSDADPNTALVGFMFRSDHPLKDNRNEKAQKQFLMDNYHDFGWEADRILTHIENCGEFYFDTITQVKMKSWTKGRVALLGDAGYCVSPLSGQGNNLALVGAYILAGELHAAGDNYKEAFNRYNTLLHPFVALNQEFGQWGSESFLREDAALKNIAEERSNLILTKLKSVANAITLPEY